LSFIYGNARNGGLGVSNMEDKYAAYKINHVSNLLSTDEGKRILLGHININKKIAKNQDVIESFEEALETLKVELPDWEIFKSEGQSFSWSVNERTGNSEVIIIDKISGHVYKRKVDNIHKMLITHAKVRYDYENYSRYNTRGLINCLESGASNFYFRECKVPMTEGLARFLVKSRAGIQFTPKRKLDILRNGSGLCNCGKFDTMRHMISCCMHRASLMTKRHNNVAKIVVQVIEACRRKELTKSVTDQYIH
jgi:hypothetical protein